MPSRGAGGLLALDTCDLLGGGRDMGHRGLWILALGLLVAGPPAQALGVLAD
jgi:hypothetical protein